MELKAFVSDAITQIVEGVLEAQAKTSPHAIVNANATRGYRQDGGDIHKINFDVAVTAETSAGGGARVAVFGVGAGMDGASKSSVASRLTFSIPIVLPKPPSN